MKPGFVRSFIGFSVSSWVGFVIGLISVPLLTSLLSPVQYAIINQFNAAILFFMSLITIGMDSGLVRFFYEPPSGFTAKQLLVKCLYYSIAILLFVSLILIPFYKQIALFMFGIEHWLVSLFFFFAIFAQIIIRYFSINYRMLNQIVSFSVLTVSLQIITKFSLLAALPFKGNDIALIAANTFGLLALSLAVIMYNVRDIVFSSAGGSLLSNIEFRKFAIGSWLVPTVLYANVYFSQVIIRHYVGEQNLGIYLSASVFAGILGVVQYGFTNFWAGYMYENYSKNQELIRKVHDYACVFSVFALCFLILMQNVLYFFIGNQFQESKPIFALVLTAPLFTLIGETTAYGISIEKKAHISLFSYVVYFCLNLILCAILVPSLGISGAAFSLMISSLLNLIIQTLFGQKYYRSIETIKRTSASIGVICTISYLNYRFNGNMGVLSLIILISILLMLLVYFKPLKYGFDLLIQRYKS